MPQENDPYLNAVRVSLNEKKIKVRQEKLRKKEEHRKSKSFLSRNLDISNYINLPEGVQNIIIFSLIIAIPYFLGVMFIFLILAQASFDRYYDLDIHFFPLVWSMGYECLAFILLMLIFKSAMCFKKC